LKKVLADTAFRNLALSMPESEEKSHFGKADFRVRNKIFAGFNDKGLAYVKLRSEQQEMVCSSEADLVRPIPGGWGRQGWTEIEHATADSKLLNSLIHMAWANVAPKTLVQANAKNERH
jgi:hypothetical protein